CPSSSVRSTSGSSPRCCDDWRRSSRLVTDVGRALAELDSLGYLVTWRGEVEAAAVERLTGASVRTLRHWRSIGEGPPSSRTIGTTALYPLEGVRDWLATQRRASPG